MLRTLLFLALVSVPLVVRGADPAPRPNILWITSEDNSAHWLGCYGNSQAETPHIDRLATEGMLFTRAYANGPVCAVARSTLLTGVHAVTQGTQHMRSRYPLPPEFRPYVTSLREAGYYCTNNAKTDYNFQGNDRAWWDDCSKRSHYKNRPEGASFFAIFNVTTSHESSLFDSSAQPSVRRLTPQEVEVPPHLADHPAIRRDIARYHDVITAMDDQVGEILTELDEAGLSDNTIVFYFSDHGGILPRGKRYLHDTGTRVPLVVRVPPAFASALPQEAGSRRDDIVQFVDFAPTLLNLAGANVPDSMTGRDFLSADNADDGRHSAFLYADRFDESYRCERAIVAGEYRYIHNFMPHLPGSPQNDYPYGIASWRALRDAADDGLLSGVHAQLWKVPQPASQLFHTASDPWEVADLASNPRHADRCLILRLQLQETMRKNRDLGVIPEPFWPELAPGESIYDYAHAGDFPWDEVVGAAFLASDGRAKNLESLTALAQHAHPVVRYWGIYGCLVLAKEAAPATDLLTKQLDDPHAANRITASHALYRIDGSPEHVARLVREATITSNDPAATLALHTLYQLEAQAEVPTEELRRIARLPRLQYAGRWAKRFLEERGE